MGLSCRDIRLLCQDIGLFSQDMHTFGYRLILFSFQSHDFVSDFLPLSSTPSPQNKESIKKWKTDVRKRVLSDPALDKWGPKEAYPCPNACPKSGLPMDNTACPTMWPNEAALLLRCLCIFIHVFGCVNVCVWVRVSESVCE